MFQHFLCHHLGHLVSKGKALYALVVLYHILLRHLHAGLLPCVVPRLSSVGLNVVIVGATN
jgi:hypothetical protein